MSGERKRWWRRRRFWLKLAAGLLFAVVAYGGAYTVAMTPLPVTFPTPRGEMGTFGEVMVQRWPRYPSDALAPIFIPAHWLDRNVRPDYWKPRRVQWLKRSGAGGSGGR